MTKLEANNVFSKEYSEGLGSLCILQSSFLALQGCRCSRLQQWTIPPPPRLKRSPLLKHVQRVYKGTYTLSLTISTPIIRPFPRTSPMIWYLSLSLASSVMRWVPTSRLFCCRPSSLTVCEISLRVYLQKGAKPICPVRGQHGERVCGSHRRDRRFLTSSTDEAMAPATGFPPKVLKWTALLSEAAISVKQSK